MHIIQAGWMDGGVKVEGIGCFVCTSIDGNNPLCDDEEKTGKKVNNSHVLGSRL